MSQKNNSINRYSITSVLLCIIFQITIISLEAETETTNAIEQKVHHATKIKPTKHSPIDQKTQHLITILRNDDTIELQKFIDDNKGYNFNKLRNGVWTVEKSTALIDCIVLNAKNCLNSLLSLNKFNRKGLKTKSSHDIYPLDYASSKVFFDKLVNYYRANNLNPKDYISEKNISRI